MNIKPITLEEYKDFAQRHGITIRVNDEQLQDILDRGNRKQQEYVDERERRAAEHDRQQAEILAVASKPKTQVELDELIDEIERKGVEE
jgi:ribulose bisphosphate carboxylase small subunit